MDVVENPSYHYGPSRVCSTLCTNRLSEITCLTVDGQIDQPHHPAEYHLRIHTYHPRCVLLYVHFACEFWFICSTSDSDIIPPIASDTGTHALIRILLCD